jgi:hypothetical protein
MHDARLTRHAYILAPPGSRDENVERLIALLAAEVVPYDKTQLIEAAHRAAKRLGADATADNRAPRSY